VIPDVFYIIAKAWLVLGCLSFLLFWACCAIGKRSDEQVRLMERRQPERWTEFDL
jgi:hypothetical protein